MLATIACALTTGEGDLAILHRMAHEVVDSALVPAGGEIKGVGRNTTGFSFRVPGGTQNYYPAFWIRDAAMMLGADLVPDTEIEGWIRIVASTQPGPKGIDFPHGLRVPPFSIPDHIALDGQACWYPGAYADQGVGNYGFLPPADDAFYFVQMAFEQRRQSKSTAFYRSSLHVGWGDAPVFEVCEKAFDSIEADSQTGLVQCDPTPGKGRVDWGFCDSITKTGSVLMPSLLRWQAAVRLASLSREIGRRDAERRFRAEADKIKAHITPVFFDAPSGSLLSATGLGRQDDVWATAFAIWLGVLRPEIEKRVATHLLNLYRSGSIAREGQIRHLPSPEHWQMASSGPETYQNGGYWATPTGWMVTALRKVERTAGDLLFAEYMRQLVDKRAAGAPFEWINPDTHSYVNSNYGSSAALVYVALMQQKA
jgi:hypothetical protein